MRKNKPKNILLQQLFLIVSFIIFFSTESQADAILPILFFYTPMTFGYASILTLLVILLEALLLKKLMKSTSFRLSLRRSIIINVISSLAGAIISWSLFENGMMLAIMLLYIPMFCLTLIIETIVLKILYRKECLNWTRSINISLGMNLLSYLFVFISQFVLVGIHMEYLSFLDQQKIKKWNDTSLFDDATGFIYTMKDETDKYVFNRFDIKNKKWESLSSKIKEKINPQYWDIKGNFIACITGINNFEKLPITVFDITNFSKITEINGNFKDIRISPDLSKLAVLEYIRMIEVPVDDPQTKSFFLGYACNLKIYELLSGILLYEAPRLALNAGLAWTNNSNEVIFASLRDESLFDVKEKKSRFSLSMKSSAYRTLAKSGQFPIDLFIFNFQQKSCNFLIEGIQPDFISFTNELSFIREKGFESIDIFQMNIEQKKPHLIASNIIGKKKAVSPDGKKYLISIPHKESMAHRSFLTIVDLNDKKRKFVIVPNYLFSHSIWMHEDIGEWN